MKFLIILCIFLNLPNAAFTQPEYTAYIFMAEECPVCNYIGKSLKRISSQYDTQVQFVAVFPQKMSNYKTASLFKKKYKLEHFKIQLDHNQILTEQFDAMVTPEVVIVNLKNVILYQGRINNAYASPGRVRHGPVTEDMELAIEKIILAKKVPKPWPKPIGCYITKHHG